MTDDAYNALGMELAFTQIRVPEDSSQVSEQVGGWTVAPIEFKGKTGGHSG